MKKITFLFIMAVASIAVNAQSKIEFNPTDGFINLAETEIPGKTQAELYDLAKMWVLETSDIHLGEEETPRILSFDGTSPDLLSINGLGKKVSYMTRYKVKMLFNEGKYTFAVTSIEYYHDSMGKWLDSAVSKSKDFYNKKGEFKSMYKFYPEIAIYFNDLNAKFKAYVAQKG